MIRKSDGQFAHGGSHARGVSEPEGTPSPRDLLEFRRAAGRSAHMLNNLLTALYCQWDLCFPKSAPSGQLPASARQLKEFLDQIAIEVRVLSRACADVPIAEGRGSSADGAGRAFGE